MIQNVLVLFVILIELNTFAGDTSALTQAHIKTDLDDITVAADEVSYQETLNAYYLKKTFNSIAHQNQLVFFLY